MKTLTFKTAISLPTTCKKIIEGDKEQVSVCDGWHISEATFGIDDIGVKHRMIIVIDRDMDCDNNINER